MCGGAFPIKVFWQTCEIDCSNPFNQFSHFDQFNLNRDWQPPISEGQPFTLEGSRVYNYQNYKVEKLGVEISLKKDEGTFGNCWVQLAFVWPPL